MRNGHYFLHMGRLNSYTDFCIYTNFRVGNLGFNKFPDPDNCIYIYSKLRFIRLF